MQKRKLIAMLSIAIVLVLCVGIAPALTQGQPQVAYAAETSWSNSYSGSYYDNLNTDKVGAAFRSDLASLITTTHTTLTTYKGLGSVFQTTDADPNQNGNIIWFYSGTSASFSGSFGSTAGTTNREHVWAKKGGDAFPAETGPGADAHHLRPAEQKLNETRSNYPFDEVPQTTGNIVAQNGSTSYGNSENGKDALCYLANGFFYPAKGYRGATARILMYMQVRWGDANNLHFVDGATTSDGKGIGKISTLFKWHLEEPPTDEEIRRNEAVYQIQGNRNPFIDHPEYAIQIYCNGYDNNSATLNNVLETVGNPYDNSQPLESISFNPNTASVAVGATTTLNLVKTPSNAAANITWTSSNPSIATVNATTGVITGVAQGTAIITATPSQQGVAAATATVTVNQITSISITGTPTKTAYTAGQKFDPTGLTVRANYNDDTFSNVALTDCQWLDGTTGNETLSAGTTTVTCKYGTVPPQTVSGITVEESQGGEFTITRSSFTIGSAYAYGTWSAGGVTGTAFIYGGTSDKMQFNNSKDHYYFASTTPAPGGLTEITLETTDSKSWELLTSNTAYGQESSNKVPAQGTSHGTSSGQSYTWALDGKDSYFTLNYKGSGVAYINSIKVKYGGSGGGTVTPPNPTDSVSLNKSSLSLTVGGSETLTATPGTAGATVTWSSSNTGVATVSSTGVVSAVAAGSATITATCGTATANCTVTVTASGQASNAKDEYLASVVTSPVAGTAYKLAIYQNQKGAVYYFAGTTESVAFRLATTTDVSQATDVMVESVSGGYHLYFMDGGTKTYIEIYEYETNKGSLKLTTATPATAIVCDGGILKSTIGSNTYYLGNYDSYTAISTSNVSYIADTSKIDVSQYPARLLETEQPTPVENLTLNKTTANLLVGGTETLVATPTGGLTGTPEWSSDNTDVATVAQDGTVSAVGEGSATITVQIGEISATCVVTVEHNIEMSTDTLMLKVGDTQTVTASATGEIEWRTSNPGVATVSDGEVTAIAAGSATITAVCGSKTLSFTVAVFEEEVPDLETQEVVITFGSGFEVKKSGYNLLNWTQSPLSGKAYVYTAQSELQFNKSGGFLLNTVATTGGIVSVKLELSKGEISDWTLLTANTAFPAAASTNVPTGGTEQTNVEISGSTAIWTLDGTHTFFTLNVAGSVSVISKVTITFNKTAIVIPEPTDSVTLDKSQLTLDGVDATDKINTVEPTSGTPVWSSSDTSVATVAQDGTVTAVGRGTATITATCGTATATCEVTVTVPYSVTLNKNTLELQVGDFETLVATANGEVTFSTIHTDVVSVDSQTGKVTALAAGTATVIALCGDQSEQCIVTVTEREIVDSVTLDKTTATVAVGGTATITATASGEVTWTTSDAAVATVANGVVTGVAAGTATITATCGTATATCEVTVTAEPIGEDSVTLDKTELSVQVGHSSVLTADASGEVAWSSSDEAIATVDNSGRVFGIAAGTATITATCGTATATCVVTVTAEPVEEDSVTLNKTELSLIKGESTTLVAVATGSVSWTSSDQAVVEVNSKGLVVAVSAGTATITATCGTATATCAVTVTESTEEKDDIAAFVAAVREIDNDGTEETFNQIKRALALYAELSTESKQEVGGSYADLLTAINAYNAAKEAINNAMIYQGLYHVFGSIIPALAALAVVILRKRFM